MKSISLGLTTFALAFTFTGIPEEFTQNESVWMPPRAACVMVAKAPRFAAWLSVFAKLPSNRAREVHSAPIRKVIRSRQVFING